MSAQIEHRLSQRASAIQPSATLAITARAKQMKSEGIDVIGFGAGEPDFPTPAHIVDAAIDALRNGDTYYVAKRGAELKNLICEKLKRDNGLDYSPKQVLVSSGAKHSLHNICQTLCEDGDEVILVAPYWVSYVEMVRLAGAEPVVINATAENGFKISPEELEASITPHTKAFMLNSPSNPTGAVYTPDEMAALAKILAKNNVYCISDEIYEELVYDDAEFKSMAAVDGMMDLTITVNGHSKAYSMTGWRIGYAAGPEQIIAKATSIQSHTTSNPTSFAQAGAAEALAKQDASAAAVQEMRKAFIERRDFLVDALNALPGVECLKPQGAFYVFPDISGTFGRTLGGVEVKDSTTFAQACLESARVALVPGVAFGADNFVRLSYATSMDNIKKGVDRLREMLEK
jgi:aspartate aminotransferase